MANSGGIETSRGSSAPQGFTPNSPNECQETSSDSRGTGKGEGTDLRSVKVHTGFRISPVVEMLSFMDGEKEKILIDLKFDGLKQLPRGGTESERPFKLQFSLWLAMKLDETTNTIELGKQGCIPLKNEDVGFVMGLSTTGDELEVHDPSKLEENKFLIRRNLQLDDNQELDLDTVKQVLLRDISSDSSGALRGAFITALVIYTVSYFLAPKGRPPKINTEIFDSITDPSRIPRLNWSSYVLKTLRESAAKVKSDISSQKSSVCLDGCLLFLQVVYLDNVEISPYPEAVKKLPRIADYSYEKINNLIKLDKRKGSKGNNDQYGTFKVHHVSDKMGNTSGEASKGGNSSVKCVMEWAFAYVDSQNSRQKQGIRQTCKDFADQLCELSDRHNEGVKKMVYKVIQSTCYNEECFADDKDNLGKDKGSTCTGAEDNKQYAVPQEKGVNNKSVPPKRHGSKRAAQRTPLAVRRARLSHHVTGHVCEENDCHASELNCLPRTLSFQQHFGTNMDKHTESETHAPKKIRTKHPANKKKTDKQKHLTGHDRAQDWEFSESL